MNERSVFVLRLRDEGGAWCPPRRWWLGLGALTLALSCVTPSSRARVPTSKPSAAASVTAGPTQPAPKVTPLLEVDPEQLAAPKPKASEPLPFDAEQLERIYAVQDIVAAASAAHGVEPALINALIWVESKFELRARGPAGAQGLMQLMPKTAGAMAKRLDRKRDSYNPDFNIHAGTLLLSRLLDRFDGDVTLALAGYNRGGGTVSKWVAAGEPLPAGVQSFAARVLEAHTWFERLPPRPAKAKPKPKPRDNPPLAARTVSPLAASSTPTQAAGAG